MKPKFFPKPEDFRKWLAENHDKSDELWVGFYKKSSGRASIDWPQSVDEALCYGWIDGKRISIDEISYKIRFTPRRLNSIWSARNLERMEILTKAGRVMPPGLAIFEKRDLSKQMIHTVAGLKPEYEAKIKANLKAWTFFQQLPPSTKKLTINYIMSAKREETRLRRLQVAIDSSEQGLKIPQLRWNKK